MRFWSRYPLTGVCRYGERIKYDIVGHSGEDNDIPFVGVAQPPENDKERLKVLKAMHAHSQFCMSGDHTLSARYRVAAYFYSLYITFLLSYPSKSSSAC